MFLINSCLGHFSAALHGLLRFRHPFSRTYGVNLPSSLTTLLPLVLGFSPHLPVSVCGTGDSVLDSDFSRQCGISGFAIMLAPRQDFETPCVLYYRAIYLPWSGFSCYRIHLSSCVLASLMQTASVQEFQPVVHRIRLPASA